MELAYEGIALPPVAWILVGLLKRIAERGGVPKGWIRDLAPVIAIVFCVVAAFVYVAAEPRDAILYGIIGGLGAAGLHGVMDQYHDDEEPKRD